MRVIRNMSAPVRHRATATPLELVPGEPVFADLSAVFQREDPWDVLLLLAGIGEAAGDQRELLREAIEEETRRRGLAGCAVVSTTRSAEKGIQMEDPLLALVLLSKSSSTVWVAKKTPVLDESTLARRLWTRDARFRGGAS